MREYLWLLQPTRHRKHQCRTEMAGASMVRVDVERTLMSVDGTTVCAVRARVQGVHPVAGATSGALTSAENVVPGAPLWLRVSSKRTASSIKIRWQEPSYHAHAVHHYEMQMRSKKTGWARIATSRKLSAEATKLSADTKYFFRVRAINGSGRAGNFSGELEAETRFSKAARAILSPFVFLGGTAAGPLVGAVGGGVGAGVLAAANVDNKAGAAAAGTAAGVAGASGGAILGTVGAPLIGGAATSRFVKGESLSPQSSDGED